MSYVGGVERFSAAWMKPHCEANVKQMTPLANRDAVNTLALCSIQYQTEAETNTVHDLERSGEMKGHTDTMTALSNTLPGNVARPDSFRVCLLVVVISLQWSINRSKPVLLAWRDPKGNYSHPVIMNDATQDAGIHSLPGHF